MSNEMLSFNFWFIIIISSICFFNININGVVIIKSERVQQLARVYL